MTLAWHLTGPVLVDGTPLPEDGVTLRIEGPLVPYQNAYHGSVTTLGALHHAAGPILCLVVLGGQQVEEADKIAAETRRVVRRVDVSERLREFARECAARAVTISQWSPRTEAEIQRAMAASILEDPVRAAREASLALAAAEHAAVGTVDLTWQEERLNELLGGPEWD